MNPKANIKKTNTSNRLLITILIVSLVLSLGCVCAYFYSKAGPSDSCDVQESTGSSCETSASSDSGQSSSADSDSVQKEKAPGGSSEESGSSRSSKKSKNGKTWVPAQYKTVTHPAETRQVKKVFCRCGACFDTYDSWLAHKNANGG